MPDNSNNNEHPYGTTLLSRDNDANRRLFPHQQVFGHIPVAASVCPNDDQCPYYSYKDDYVELENASSPSQADETPIHILVAAFRDRLCGRTIHNAFTHAKNPKR